MMSANVAVTDPQSAPSLSRSWRERARAGWGALLLTTIARTYLVFTLTLLATAVLPALLSWDSYVVRTGSMSPGIRVGDVVLTAPLSLEEALAPGHVFTFVDPAETSPSAPDKVLVHRIVEDNGDGTFMTAGDANRAHDSTPVPRASFLGRGRLLVPMIGRPSLWATTGNYGALALLTVVSVLAVILAFPAKDARPRREGRPATRAAWRLPRLVAGTTMAVTLSCVALAFAVAGFSSATRNPDSRWTLSQLIDITHPSVNVSFPADGGAYNATGWNAGCTSTPKICGTAADAGSGVANVKVSVRQGMANYWNGSSFASASEMLLMATGTTTWSYAFPAGNLPADGPFTVRVVAADSAASSNTTSVSRTFTYDTTAPSGGSIAYTNGYAAATSVSLTLVTGSDGGSGLNAAATQIQRASATQSAGACGSFGTFATLGPANPSSPFVDSTLASGNCYQYRYLVPDNTGNVATSTTASVVRVDTVAPANALSLSGSPGAFLSGSTLYFASGGAGSLTMVDTVSDAAAGPASATFPAMTTTGWAHSLETDTTPAGGPYSSSAFTWTAVAATPVGYTVTGTDGAGRQATTAALTFVPDALAPATGSLSYTNGYVTSLSVPVTLVIGADVGSGIRTLGTQVQRQSATLSAGVCGTFGTFANVGTAGPSSPLADVTVVSGNCYMYRYLVPDNVGNTTTYVSTSVAKVDAAGPTNALTLSAPSSAFMAGSTVFYKSNGSGSFAIVDTVGDPGSVPVSVLFPAIATTGWTHNNETDVTGPPYTSAVFNWTTSPSNPTGYVVTSTDGAGNQSPQPITFTPDVTAPAGGSISYVNGYVTATSVITLANGTDAGSGVNPAATQLQRASATLTGTTCGTFSTFTNLGSPSPSSSFTDTTDVTGKCYEYQYLVPDNLGNSFTYTSAAVAKFDTTSLPTGTVTAPAANGFVGGATVAVTSNSADGVSGVLSAQFQTSLSGAATWTNLGAADTTSPYGVSWNTLSGFPNGTYDVRVVTSNVAGSTFTSAANTVEVQNGGPTPTSMQLLNGSGTAGTIDEGDTIVVTYSQSLHVNSLCSTWPASGDGSDQSVTANKDVDVAVADGGASNDTLTIGSTSCTFHFGAIGLGAPGFTTGGNLSFGRAGSNKSTVTWSQSAHTLTIVLGSQTGAGTSASVTSSVPTYTPDPAITSAVGTPITGTFSTPNAKQF